MTLNAAVPERLRKRRGHLANYDTGLYDDGGPIHYPPSACLLGDELGYATEPARLACP
jgi:hypothetical protein